MIALVTNFAAGTATLLVDGLQLIVAVLLMCWRHGRLQLLKEAVYGEEGRIRRDELSGALL